MQNYLAIMMFACWQKKPNKKTMYVLFAVHLTGAEASATLPLKDGIGYLYLIEFCFQGYWLLLLLLVH